MTSIITGDIANSRKSNRPKEWLKPIKALFNKIGKTPKTWQIYRGDSFQIEVTDIQEALQTAIEIKATIKGIKGLDVRMAIGIGEKEFDSPKVTESNGDAFIRSGESFEQLKKHTLAINSPWQEINTQINLCIQLASLTMDNWTSSSAEIFKVSLQTENATQQKIANQLGITQGRVSERQKRAGLEEIMKMIGQYRILIGEKLQTA
jgi:hypothetical protein